MQDILHRGSGRAVRLVVYVFGVLWSGVVFAGVSAVLLSSTQELSSDCGLSMLLKAFVCLFLWCVLAALLVIWFLSPWIFPMRVVLEDGRLSLTYLWHRRELLFENVAWAGKMLPTIGLFGNYTVLWIVIVATGRRFPHNWCVFRVRSENIGLCANECATSLDSLFDKFTKK